MMSYTVIKQSELIGRLREIEQIMLEGNTCIYSLESSMTVTAYLIGRGYEVLNVPEGDSIVVGIIPGRSENVN